MESGAAGRGEIHDASRVPTTNPLLLTAAAREVCPDAQRLIFHVNAADRGTLVVFYISSLILTHIPNSSFQG